MVKLKQPEHVGHTFTGFDKVFIGKAFNSRDNWHEKKTFELLLCKYQPTSIRPPSGTFWMIQTSRDLIKNGFLYIRNYSHKRGIFPTTATVTKFIKHFGQMYFLKLVNIRRVVFNQPISFTANMEKKLLMNFFFWIKWWGFGHFTICNHIQDKKASDYFFD